MRRRASELVPDSFTTSIRYALLALVFCVVSAVELLHAKFALLTLSELHAYWLGREGRFPFGLLPWSEQHFGGDALAMRVPELGVFALLLAVALLGLDRMVLRRISVLWLTICVVVALFALGLQQMFALKHLRMERHAFLLLRDRVEHAAAPGEEIVAGENLLLPLYEYGPDGFRQQLRIAQQSDAGIVPAVGGDAQRAEVVFVGSADELFARKLREAGYSFRKDPPSQPDSSELVAHYYRAASAGIYFVSPPVMDDSGAVSSKP